MTGSLFYSLHPSRPTPLPVLTTGTRKPCTKNIFAHTCYINYFVYICRRKTIVSSVTKKRANT